MNNFSLRLLAFFLIANFFLISGCESDKESKKTTSVSVNIFNGTVKIPSNFIVEKKESSTTVNFFRERLGADGLSPTADIIVKGLIKGGDYKYYAPKENHYRVVDSIIEHDFYIETWTPKADRPLANMLFTTIIYNDNEFLGVSSEDRNLWRSIFDTYKTQ